MGDDSTKMHRECSQCDKQAVIAVGDAALCVECYYKYEVASTLAFRIQAIGLNHAIAEMDHITGLGLRSPQMQVPDIPKGPIILNNIKVANSVVGSINTGTVQAIDVKITTLKNAGNEGLSNALSKLAEAITNDQSMPAPEKNDLLDQVSFLSEQAAAAAEDRRPGLIKSTLSTVTNAAVAVNAVASAWNVVEPLLKAQFGFGLI